MKLVTFQRGKEQRVGAVLGDLGIDINLGMAFLTRRGEGLRMQPLMRNLVRRVLANSPAPRDMVGLLAHGQSWHRALEDVLTFLALHAEPGRSFKGLFTPLKKVRLRAPIPRPGKIICVGRNYAEHARERGSEIPSQPIFFLKSSNTICGPGDPIVLPSNSTQVDYEAELAVVIGKRGRRIPEDRAYEYVAGYTILNDASARDMQAQDKQWFRGKSCDTFAPLGPWIVTRDEIPDPHTLRIALVLNGHTMQDSNTSCMIFKIPYLISYLSQSLTWEPGDVLSTGTPEGVGAHRTPPIFLKPGDMVSITVEQIGTLTNPVGGP